jgi:hypothetical protein
MSPREAVCQYSGWEFSESADYRYHYGRTAGPIYSTPTGYICAVANGKKPHAYDGLTWAEAIGSAADYVKSKGKTIYISSGEIEND